MAEVIILESSKHEIVDLVDDSDDDVENWKDAQRLAKHFTEKINERRIRCRICYKIFCTPLLVRTHMLLSHMGCSDDELSEAARKMFHEKRGSSARSTSFATRPYNRAKRKPESSSEDSESELESIRREYGRPLRSAAVNATKRLRQARKEDLEAEKIIRETDPIKPPKPPTHQIDRKPYIAPEPTPTSEYEKKRMENIERNAEQMLKLGFKM